MDLKPETRNPKPETRNPKPETRNPEPETRNPKPSFGVLLVNLGSPDAPTAQAVKPYLDEFLMDERVIDAPKWLRTFLVRGIILNTRPKKSAAAYSKIWWDEGSPLIVLSQRLKEKLQSQLEVPVALGMRYGNPSIEAGLQELMDAHPSISEVFLIPLYPHYAMSSYETVVVKAEEIQQARFPNLTLAVMPPFYQEKNYIAALSESIRPFLHEKPDLLLFSYHGIPERHVKKSDVTGCHCLKVENCCEIASAAHAQCYRHQVMQTTHAVAERLGLSKNQYRVSFQSRLGTDPWLKPMTSNLLEELPEQGVQKLAVVCPAFVSDCLETLEEMGMEGKKAFLQAGGESFTLIPCLNDKDDWVEVLRGYVEEAQKTKAHA